MWCETCCGILVEIAGADYSNTTFASMKRLLSKPCDVEQRLDAAKDAIKKWDNGQPVLYTEKDKELFRNFLRQHKDHTLRGVMGKDVTAQDEEKEVEHLKTRLRALQKKRGRTGERE
jgi:hypothetical protein